MKQILIASTSSLHNQAYLEYLTPTLSRHFTKVKTILFIPFARPGGISHDKYTRIAHDYFKTIGKQLIGIHNCNNMQDAIVQAQGIFVGGGNTFVLVKQLHEANLMAPLRRAILNGTPYLGTSAGSNICGLTMQTTNDMPIVYPPSFKTLGVIPFNINPHYLDPDPTGTHMGETRETRINEFHEYNSIPVVGLREGSWLLVNNTTISLKGNLDARVFTKNNAPLEADATFNFSDLN